MVFFADGSVVTQNIYGSTRLGRCDPDGRSMGALTLSETVTSLSQVPSGTHVWATAGANLVRIDAGGLVDVLPIDGDVAYVQSVSQGAVVTAGRGEERRHVLVNGRGEVCAEGHGEKAIVDRHGRSVRVVNPVDGSPEVLAFDEQTAHESPLTLDAVGSPTYELDVPGLHQMLLRSNSGFEWNTLPGQAIGAACTRDGERIAWVERDRVVLANRSELTWTSDEKRRVCVTAAENLSTAQRLELAKVLAPLLGLEPKTVASAVAAGRWLAGAVEMKAVPKLEARFAERGLGVTLYLCPPY